MKKKKYLAPYTKSLQIKMGAFMLDVSRVEGGPDYGGSGNGTSGGGSMNAKENSFWTDWMDDEEEE